ncbi:MAG: hypothetical protein MJE66_14910, partial [Proteobacteria bacterium]|nr:hypothetical protein [Pseudomonadota bacterium]
MSTPLRLSRASLVLVVAMATACTHVDHTDDVDRTPVVNTGAGATILMPGQTAPPISGSRFPGGAPAPGGAGEAPAGAAPQPGGGVTFFGGTETDEKTHRTTVERPLWWKYAALPFAIAAYPVKKAADAIQGEPEPGPPLPHSTAAAPPPSRSELREAAERARLRQLEEQLEQRQPNPGPIAGPTATAPRPRPPYGRPTTAPPHSPYTRPTLGAETRSTSIAQELAALRRRRESGA